MLRCSMLSVSTLLLLSVFLFHESSAAITKPGFGSAKYALVIGIDGLGSLYLNSTSVHPNIDSLIATGASTMLARDSLPTVSKPNWAAILAGAGPEETGVDNNLWYYLPNCVNYGVIDAKCVGCATCTALVPILQELFRENPSVYNFTINALEDVLHKVCNQLGFPLKTACNSVVNRLVPKLFDEVFLNQTVPAICDEIQVCRNQLSSLSGSGTLFPTMFKLVKYFNPLFKTALYTDHSVVVNLIEKNVVDYFSYMSEDAAALVNQLVPVIETNQPELVFFHFDTIDESGHQYGWGSPEYLSAIEQVDTEIGQLLAAYQSAGIIDDTIVLVTADHGGNGTNHGFINLDNVQIPWIANGPGIQQGYTLQNYVRDMDIPATAMWALGIEQNHLWQGHPVIEAWQGTPAQPVTPPNALTQHVVVVTISGLTVNGFVDADTPIMDALAANGASTLKARTVMPTNTLSNIASILMGAGPEETGICSGDVQNPCNWSPPPAVPELPPIVNPTGLFPSIYDAIAASGKQMRTAAFFNNYLVGEVLNVTNVGYIYQNTTNDKDVALTAAQYFYNQPNFTFVQFDQVQQAGEKHGYNSSQYLSAVTQADSSLAFIVDALQFYMPNHIIIVTSDHGGILKESGKTNDECVIVPWIAAGTNIRYAFQIEQYVKTMDTAAVSAWALGVTAPSAWIADPLLTLYTAVESPSI